MKKHLYTYFNKKADFYVPPFVSDNDIEEQVEDIQHSLPYIKESDATPLLDCDLIHLGTFDTLTGEIVFKKTFVMPLGNELRRVLESRSSDGTKENA